jgi:hypothetical protein
MKEMILPKGDALPRIVIMPAPKIHKASQSLFWTTVRESFPVSFPTASLDRESWIPSLALSAGIRELVGLSLEKRDDRNSKQTQL